MGTLRRMGAAMLSFLGMAAVMAKGNPGMASEFQRFDHSPDLHGSAQYKPGPARRMNNNRKMTRGRGWVQRIPIRTVVAIPERRDPIYGEITRPESTFIRTKWKQIKHYK